MKFFNPLSYIRIWLPGHVFHKGIYLLQPFRANGIINILTVTDRLYNPRLSHYRQMLRCHRLLNTNAGIYFGYGKLFWIFQKFQDFFSQRMINGFQRTKSRFQCSIIKRYRWSPFAKIIISDFSFPFFILLALVFVIWCAKPVTISFPIGRLCGF